MRNAVTLGVSENRLDAIRRQLKLLCNFWHGQAVIEIVNDGAHGHTSTAQHRRAALHSALYFHELAVRPVDCVCRGHDSILARKMKLRAEGRTRRPQGLITAC